MNHTLTLLTALLLAPLAALHAADVPKFPPTELPTSIRPDPKWTAEAAEDAKQDFASIPYDGITPNKLVCDTTLRELPDGSWALFMLAGDDFEPSPKNFIALPRSFDKGKTWSPLQPVDIGLPREGRTMGQGPTELMIPDGSPPVHAHNRQSWPRAAGRPPTEGWSRLVLEQGPRLIRAFTSVLSIRRELEKWCRGFQPPAID